MTILRLGLAGITVCAGLCAALVPARAADLLRYDVATGDGSANLSHSVVHGGISATPLQQLGGLVPDAAFATAGFSATAWPENVYGTQRMELTITPMPGMSIRLDSVAYAFGGFPKMTYKIVTSVDGFATPIAGPFTVPAGDANDMNNSLAALPLITGAITFRWVAFSDSSVASMNDLKQAGFFDGETPFPILFRGSVVPEPGSVGLLAVGVLVLCRRRSTYFTNAAASFNPTCFNSAAR